MPARMKDIARSWAYQWLRYRKPCAAFLDPARKHAREC